MRDESAAFLAHAEVLLGRADVMLSVNLNEDAAREAYMASFYAAQAYIFERTGKVSKTHHGVQTEFFRLTKEDPRADQELRRFLSRSYEYKSIADYGMGSEAVTSATEAADAVAMARLFLAHFRSVVPLPAAGGDKPIIP